ncbi:hypothetical protein F183_A00870 [Bryobacterales bacterium F-183]|nr:hypothetical protein F183_A00870 [Bryobacterales bacterium F-183]
MSASSIQLDAWLDKVYGTGHEIPRPSEAEAALRSNPELARLAPYAAGDLEAIRANPSATHRGMPPLVAVTMSSLSRIRPNDFLACAEHLVKQGEPLDSWWEAPAFPGSRLTPLYGAAGMNHVASITKLLLDAGANPDDNESLYHSIEAHDLTCFRLLLAAKANPNGCNALLHALDYDRLEIIEALLAAGADPNEERPALHWAIYRRRSPAHIRTLLNAGADPTYKIHGMTMARMALYFGMKEAAAMLAERTGETFDQPIDRFIAACTSADRDTAKSLIQADPTLIQKLPEGAHRLLPDLVQAKANSSVKLMVETGWPIEAIGGDWKATALNLAIFRGDTDLTRFLLKHGASWETQHGFGSDARGTLAWASRNNPWADTLSCAKALIEAGMPKPSQVSDYSPAIQAYFASL